MTITQAVAADAAALDSLEESVFRADYYPLSKRAFYYHIRHNLLLVARDEHGELMGYVLALVHYKRPKIYSLAIHKQYRNQGLGEALLQHLLINLQEVGFVKVVLEVQTTNVKAIRLYERMGFHTIDELGGFYKDGSAAYLMEKALSA